MNFPQCSQEPLCQIVPSSHLQSNPAEMIPMQAMEPSRIAQHLKANSRSVLSFEINPRDHPALSGPQKSILDHLTELCTQNESSRARLGSIFRPFSPEVRTILDFCPIRQEQNTPRNMDLLNKDFNPRKTKLRSFLSLVIVPGGGSHGGSRPRRSR